MFMMEEEEECEVQKTYFYHKMKREHEKWSDSESEEEKEAQEKIRIEKMKEQQIELEMEMEMEKQRKLEKEKRKREKAELKMRNQIQIQIQLEEKQEKENKEKEAEQKQKEEKQKKIKETKVTMELELELEVENAKKQTNMEEQEVTINLLDLDSENEQEEIFSESFTEKADALLLEAENILLDLKSKNSETSIENQVENSSITVEKSKPTLAIFSHATFLHPPLIFSQSQLQKVGNSSASSSESSHSAENNSTEEILNRFAFKKYKRNLIESFEREFEYLSKKDEEEITNSESNSSKLSTPPPSFEKATAFQNLDLDLEPDAEPQIPLLTLVQKTGKDNQKERESGKTGQLPVIEKEAQIARSSTTNLSENYRENLPWVENNDCDFCPLLTCIFACIFKPLK